LLELGFGALLVVMVIRWFSDLVPSPLDPLVVSLPLCPIFQLSRWRTRHRYHRCRRTSNYRLCGYSYLPTSRRPRTITLPTCKSYIWLGAARPPAVTAAQQQFAPRGLAAERKSARATNGWLGGKAEKQRSGWLSEPLRAKTTNDWCWARDATWCMPFELVDWVS
jgi:hypothetical protein